RGLPQDALPPRAGLPAAADRPGAGDRAGRGRAGRQDRPRLAEPQGLLGGRRLGDRLVVPGAWERRAMGTFHPSLFALRSSLPRSHAPPMRRRASIGTPPLDIARPGATVR